MATEGKQLALWELEPRDTAIDQGAFAYLADWFLSIPDPDETPVQVFRRGVKTVMNASRRREISEAQAKVLLVLMVDSFVASNLHERLRRFWTLPKERQLVSRARLVAVRERARP